MPTVAYIANEFPNAVEWYVGEEIRELRMQGVQVVACSARRVGLHLLNTEQQELGRGVLCLGRPVHWGALFKALWLCVRSRRGLADFWRRILLEGDEPPSKRLRALAHTWLGAYYACLLHPFRVDHIHVHHGYYAAWIAMVAARLLGVPYSLTLHGSDLLLHGAYLDIKLRNCAFCLTVSEFNRRYILTHFPQVAPEDVLLRRLGADIPPAMRPFARGQIEDRQLVLFAAGRLHRVKNYAFLVQACFFLKELGVNLRCLIAGEGRERKRLEFLIHELDLDDTVQLVGHVPHDQIGHFYDQADLIVLTSLSEGIPLVLMEAMAHARLVLAPAITGIPELVLDGKTGFLYPPGRLEEFVWQVDQIARSLHALESVRQAAREHVRLYFNDRENLRLFVDLFLRRISPQQLAVSHENPVLQQI